jgi:predicted dehydrogenase
VIPSVRFGTPQGHEGLIHDIVDSLVRDIPPATDGTQGLTAVSVLEALYQSATAGHEVTLE